jgi:hypothetical protein
VLYGRGVVNIVFLVAVVVVVVVVAGGGSVVLGVYRPHLPRPKYSNPRTQNHDEFSA